jgi:hypothetical protein
LAPSFSCDAPDVHPVPVSEASIAHGKQVKYLILGQS